MSSTLDGVQNEANSLDLLHSMLLEQRELVVGCTQQLSAQRTLCEKIKRDLGEVAMQVNEVREEMDALSKKVTSLDDLKTLQPGCKAQQKLPKDLSVSSYTSHRFHNVCPLLEIV